MTGSERDDGAVFDPPGVQAAGRIEPSDFSGPDGPELVAELGHTMRSRLTSILFLAESLHRAMAAEGDEGRRRQVGLLYGSALTASVFASNIMELARGGDDLVGVEPEPISVTGVLRTVHDSIRPVAEERGVTIEVDPSEPDERPGHPLALRRILLGLAVVTLEFTDHGVLTLSARATGSGSTEFCLHAPAAMVDADDRASLDRPVQPRKNGEGWHWSPASVAVTTARQLLEKTGAELAIETEAVRGLRFRFETVLAPVDTR